MKPFDEILFEKRNKEYGSYVLRKKYGKHLMTSLIIGILFLGTVIAYPVIASYMNKSKTSKDLKREIGIEMLNAPKEDFTPPPPPPAAPINTPRFVAPTVVEEDVETTMGTQDELANVPSAPPSNESEVIITEETTPPVIDQPKPAEIFTVVEEQPVLEGMYEFLSKNIRYPDEAKELGIQGKVFVTFVVEADGSVSNVRVLRGIGGGCDEEAIRVVQSMPKWTPGKQRGNSVRVQFNIPVKFTLN